MNFLSIGGGQNGIISEVLCYESNNGVYYKAKVKFYLFDFYDWSYDGGEEDLCNLHLYGLAKSFLDYGCYETSITWKKGSRFPIYNSYALVDIEEVTFDNLTDDSLNTAYLASYYCYRY